jgi:dTMP kinase
MGYLVSIEGIDASGKSSIIEPLALELRKSDIKVTSLDKKYIEYEKEEINRYTKELRDLIWYKSDDPRHFVSDQGWLYFHALWYTILCNNKLKWDLDQNDIVIVDGWIYKIYCRFLLKENFNFELLNTVKNSIRKTDMTFILDVSPHIAWNRRCSFKSTELGGYENIVTSPKESFINYQEKVRKKLLHLAKEEEWDVICADNMSIDEEVNEIKNIILNKMYI